MKNSAPRRRDVKSVRGNTFLQLFRCAFRPRQVRSARRFRARPSGLSEPSGLVFGAIGFDFSQPFPRATSARGHDDTSPPPICRRSCSRHCQRTKCHGTNASNGRSSDAGKVFNVCSRGPRTDDTGCPRQVCKLLGTRSSQVVLSCPRRGFHLHTVGGNGSSPLAPTSRCRNQYRLLAQLVEHHLDTVGVSGSSPLEPTSHKQFTPLTLNATERRFSLVELPCPP